MEWKAFLDGALYACPPGLADAAVRGDGRLVTSQPPRAEILTGRNPLHSYVSQTIQEYTLMGPT